MSPRRTLLAPRRNSNFSPIHRSIGIQHERPPGFVGPIPTFAKCFIQNKGKQRSLCIILIRGGLGDRGQCSGGCPWLANKERSQCGLYLAHNGEFIGDYAALHGPRIAAPLIPGELPLSGSADQPLMHSLDDGMEYYMDPGHNDREALMKERVGGTGKAVISGPIDGGTGNIFLVSRNFSQKSCKHLFSLKAFKGADPRV